MRLRRQRLQRYRVLGVLLALAVVGLVVLLVYAIVLMQSVQNESSHNLALDQAYQRAVQLAEKRATMGAQYYTAPTTTMLADRHQNGTQLLEAMREIQRLGGKTPVRTLARDKTPAELRAASKDYMSETQQPSAVLDPDDVTLLTALHKMELAQSQTGTRHINAMLLTEQLFVILTPVAVIILVVIIVVAALIFRHVKRIQALARSDALLELPNHRTMVEILEKELERASRSHTMCALLFIDIDHFKSLNDTHGHHAGDEVLRQFARVLTQTLRSVDIVGRWGGEEFVAVLPGSTVEDAQIAAERVRAAIAFHGFSVAGGLHLTCSLGIAVYPLHAQTCEELVNAADGAMYLAKRMGRNQIRLSNDPAKNLLAAGGLRETREDAALTGVVDALAALIEAHDQDASHHTRRVSMLSMRLALELGFDAVQAYMIGLAGRLQNIGKISVPLTILQKPETLTADEWVLIRQHTQFGADVINRVPALRAITPLIQAHHERWDGSGYPEGLSGEAIPLGARIIGVADAYEALCNERPYRHAHSPEAALEIIREEAGRQFDPRVVEILIAMVTTDIDEEFLAPAS